MNKPFLFLLVISLFWGCKKDVPIHPNHVQYFSLDLKWDAQPTVFKDAESNIIMGLNDINTNGTHTYRFIKISKDGAVLTNTTYIDSLLFPGYLTLFTSIKLVHEMGRLFLVTTGIKNSGIENRPYIATVEFNEALEKLSTSEKKMQIGQLSINDKTPFFFQPVSDGFLIAMNTLDNNQTPVVYFEKTDLGLNTTIYKKINNSFWEEMGANNSNLFVYSKHLTGQPTLYSFDHVGNASWTHTIQYSTSMNIPSDIKIRLTITKDKILILPMNAAGNAGPIVTYACGLDGQKITETEISNSSENYLNYLSIEDAGTYYSGTTCVGPGKCKPFWAKMDSELKVVFSKVLPEDFSQNMQALFVGETSAGYYLFGLKDDYSSNIPLAFFIKTDSQGNFVD